MPVAHGAGLGQLKVQSALGQPLVADVDVPSVERDEAASLQVHLATQAAFAQANLEFNSALSHLRLDLDARPDGSYVVHITSVAAISEPYLDLLLELTWNGGRVLRAYTVLLDPPGLHEAQQIIPPAAAPPVAAAQPAPAPAAQPEPAAAAPATAAPVAAAPANPPAPVAAAPEPAPAPAPAPQAAPAEPRPAPRTAEAAPPAPPAEPAAPASVRVRSGDTLGKIALQTKPREVSLDQMLVALVQANPKAFIEGNMNLLLAGKEMSVPTAQTALAIDQADAHREVLAQSADFAAYRSRIAQLSTAAPVVPETNAAVGGKGTVTAKVEDKAAPPKSGDQLKIAKNDAASTAAAAAARKDEEAAKARALKEEKERAAALAKTNEEIRKANEIAQKAAAAAQKKAEAEKAEADRKDAARKAAEAKEAARKEAEAAKAEAARKAAEAKETARKEAEAAKAEAARKAAEAKEAARKEAEAKIEAAKAEVAKAEAAKAEAARAEAAKAEAARAEAARAEAAKADAAKAEAAKADAAKAEPAKTEAPKPAPAPVAAKPAAPSSGLGDLLTSPLVLGGIVGALVLVLVGLNFLRRNRSSGAGQIKGEGDPMTANSLFGTAGGQSVDTGATSTFNSSFIPAASQLDSNEVDPIAEADVYIAYGREEQAEDILKEALRLQPDRHAVRAKLLEIYARRGDKASFNAVAQELHTRTAGVGEEWERAAKLGRTLDPDNALYAGAPEGESLRGPTTNLRLDGGLAGAPPSGVDGPTLAAAAPGALDFQVTTPGQYHDEPAPAPADPFGMSAGTTMPASERSPETAMPLDSRMASGSDSRGGGAEQSRTFEAQLPAEHEFAPAPAPAPVPKTTPIPKPVPASMDFGSLDFDLGPSKMTLDSPTVPPQPATQTNGAAAAQSAGFEPPTIPSLDLMFPPPAGNVRPGAPPPTVSGSVPIPNIDLNLPTQPGGGPAAGSLEEALSRPTLVGAVGALADGDMQRLTSNTDQATVPLIDFDLTGADAALSGRRTETQAGSPMASQMATKLDLARGYIDLGVKDGARELLEEVMKDGTREQRQQAVELIKLVEA